MASVDPVILVCGAGIIIALGTIIYVFVDDLLHHRDFLKSLADFEERADAWRAVRETETVHIHSGVVKNADTPVSEQ